MTQIRAQVITTRAGDLPRDHIVNQIHFATSAAWELITDGPNWTNIAEDIRDMFATRRQYIPTGYGVEVKVYNVDDALPREVMHHAPRVAYAEAAQAPGPREVALCLSFHGARNIPRQRGRLFIGPWTQQVMGERPPAAAQATCLYLAEGLADIGGVDVDWSVRSKFPIELGDQGGTMHSIQHSWSDDEWDTVRSRGLRATGRQEQDHSE
jgi:hypothetical protein